MICADQFNNKTDCLTGLIQPHDNMSVKTGVEKSLFH